jgi:serine/threonine-protein kinase
MKDPEGRQGSALQLTQEFEAALYEAGIELKLIGMNTPGTPFAVGPYSQRPSRGYSTPPEILRQVEEVSAKDEGPILAQVESPVLVRGDEKGPTRRFSGRTSFSDSVVEQFRSTFTGIRTDQRLAQSKVPIIVIASVVVLALIAGIIWLRQSPPESDKGVTEADTYQIVVPEGMVLIPAGNFTMGYNGSDQPSEKPEHAREVDAFFIDKHEVAVGDYYAFIKASKHAPPKNWPRDWAEGRFTPEEAKLPVTGVTWFDAREYAEFVGKRLPTEIEWEYAARGTDKRLYPWGAELKPNLANVGDGGKKPLKSVDSYPGGASPFGVLNMTGNAFEWTDSDPLRYPGSNANPTQGKIVRGGSATATKEFALVTSRTSIPPNEAYPDLGFRCAKSLSRR